MTNGVASQFLKTSNQSHLGLGLEVMCADTRHGIPADVAKKLDTIGASTPNKEQFAGWTARLNAHAPAPEAELKHSTRTKLSNDFKV